MNVRRPILSLWTDLECASGTLVATLEVVDGIHDRGLDLVDSLDVTVWPGDLTLDAFTVARRVIRVEDEVLGTFEYPILEAVEREAASEAPVIRVKGVPPWTVLAEGGFYDSFTAGGSSQIVLGSVTQSVPDWITDIIAAADRNGADYFTAGASISSWAAFDVTLDASEKSVWQVLTELQQGLSQPATGDVPDLVFARDGGSAYDIDILTAPRGSTLASRRLDLGVNLTSVQRQTRRGDLASVIRPRGLVPAGELEPSDISEVVLRVADITSLVVEVEWPDAPTLTVIAADDQLNGQRAIFPDGSLVEITDSSAANQTITVASASGLSVGDLIGLAADSSGTALQEIQNPASVAAHGRRLASPQYPTFRRERNWILNPQFADNLDPVPLLHFIQTTAEAAGVVTLSTGVPDEPVIVAGDLLCLRVAGQYTSFLITSGGTPDASGIVDVTLAIDPGTVSASGGGFVVLQGERDPDHWAASGDDGFRNRAVITTRALNSATDAQSWTGTINGTVWNANSTAGTFLSSTTPSTGTLGYGDRFSVGSSNYALASFVVTEEINANVGTVAGGTTSAFHPFGAGTGSGSATITSPPLYLLEPYSSGTVIAMCEHRRPAATSRPSLLSDVVNVRSYTGRTTGWARAHFLLWPISDVTYSGDRKVTLRVLDGSGTELATVTDIDRDLVGGTAVYVDLGVQVDLAGAVDDLRLEFRVGIQNTAFPQVYYFLASGQFTLGADDTVPPVRFSFGNDLYRRGLADSVRRASPPETLEVGFRDLAYDEDFVASEWSVDVGQTVEVVTSTGESVARVVRRRTNLRDPVDSDLVVGAESVRLTRGV